MKRNPTLRIVNSLPLCVGLITRQRVTVQREEKAVLDFFIVCESALAYIESMKVDEEGLYRLTNFHSRNRRTYTDHNALLLSCRFEGGQTKPQHTELFNFKSAVGQQLFTEETTNTNKFSECFEGNIPFIQQAHQWFKTLNKTFFKGL